MDTTRPEIGRFIDEVSARQHVDRDWLRRLLEEAQSKQVIIDTMQKPAEKVKPWFEYRRIFVTEKRIREGRAFYAAHQDVFDATAAQTGVPAPVMIAILGAETSYGRSVGTFRALDALATLAFDYPARASYFRGELEQFVALARDGDLDPLTALSSYAGALGAPQFMPTNVRKFGLDGDEDGKIDLYSDWPDIAQSIANYLVHHGWAKGEPLYARATLVDPDVEDLHSGLDLNTTVGALRREGVVVDANVPDATPALFAALRDVEGPTYRVGYKNFWVITRYNHSLMYALAVSELAEAIGAAGP
jgi:membrane-bound lytic murein transglycosylase B